MEFWDLFEDIVEIPNSPKYDGYSPLQALERLRSLIKDNNIKKSK